MSFTHHFFLSVSTGVVCLLSFVQPAPAQTFTRILSGPHVNNVAASRSVNWVDVDGDGDLDLFVSNGLEGGQNNVLYINNGADSSYTFTQVNGDPIVQDNMPSDGSSWGDVDNDGDMDAFVVNWYDLNNLFYLNNGNGTFTQVTTGTIVNDGGYSETCSWGDYDNDGYLDLYVTNSGSPTLGAKVNFLYKNNGNGTFSKITTGEITTDARYSRGANWVDYDNDGDLDMFVANERNQANNLYKNMLKETGTATFTKITTGSIVTDLASSWSSSWGDYDNDGDLDVFVTNGWPSGQNDFLYDNNGDGTFTRVTTGPEVTDAAYSACAGWGDYDNDGDLDLFVTTAYGPSASKNLLYQNNLIETGTATFTKITTGDVVNDLGYSYGFAWGDYDQDGDLDIYTAKTFNEAESSVLYRNDNSNANRWLEVRCVGDSSNRSGIGTKVWVKAVVNGNSIWQLRVVEGQSGYCGQSVLLHFGLGTATQVDSIRIIWPSGIENMYGPVNTDQILTLVETPTAMNLAVHSGWNLLSVPFVAGGVNPASVFTGAVSPAFRFVNAFGYSVDTSLVAGRGIWIKFDSAGVVPFAGVHQFDGQLAVTQGWNIIGPLDFPVSAISVTTTPPGIVSSPFYGFNGGYAAEDTLESGKGYWVKAGQDGVLHLSRSPQQLAGVPVPK